MKIIAADIYDTDLHPWKPPIILRLITDEGIYGLGEFPLAYGIGRQAAIAMTKEMVEHYVIGADPCRRGVWHTLFRRVLGQGGGPVVYGGSARDEVSGILRAKPSGVRSTTCWAVRYGIALQSANGWCGEWAPETTVLRRRLRISARSRLRSWRWATWPQVQPFTPRGGPDHERVLEPWRDLGYARVKAVRDAVGLM